ncbi:polyphenol oxidase family protein [Paratractidigestivibacter sp.]|uniref:polyphenol oxidase family protein n=1 Tax=Paratractidigestivibacter sp. TaxID=2847316 RepID=UPI004025A897
MALLSDTESGCGVTFAFTERTGGVSAEPFASLNLGDSCGDAPAAVAENRRRALTAIGAADCAGALVTPHQAAAQARSGADAVVCTAPDVPVLLCFADCVPAVICAPGGFAVAHSGWRGTIARIAQKTARVLMDETGCAAADLKAYVGPHIGGVDYEVSAQMIRDFTAEFGEGVHVGVASRRKLDLGYAVACALTDAGVLRENLAVCRVSTATATDRFFSYRAEAGNCGRHAALAVMRTGTTPAWEPLD